MLFFLRSILRISIRKFDLVFAHIYSDKRKTSLFSSPDEFQSLFLCFSRSFVSVIYLSNNKQGLLFICGLVHDEHREQKRFPIVLHTRYYRAGRGQSTALAAPWLAQLVGNVGVMKTLGMSTHKTW